MERHILKHLGEDSLVLAMDEVDNVLDSAFRVDFFGMLRSWHGMRGAYEPTIWNRLDLALVISTEPYQLIGNLVQSPFNVGEVIELADFTRADVADLNRRHTYPLAPAEEEQLFELLGGHPYLTRRALYLVASQSISPQELFAHAADDGGPFGDHLRYHFLRLCDRGDQSQEALRRQEQLVSGLTQVIEGRESRDRMKIGRAHV